MSTTPLSKVLYNLVMFPYPSGATMHVGHASNFIPNDILVRRHKMNGHRVINPIGWDSFGLPTENFAIKQGKPAVQVTDENITVFKKQLEKLDMDYDINYSKNRHDITDADGSREFATSDPSYYKWTQWVFIKLFEQGLVYRKEALVNRCPGCQTVIANDQVVNGRCERCESEIIQKKHPQRFIKITDYADRLLSDLDLVDRPEETKTMQRNWIGKSEGSEVVFKMSENHLSPALSFKEREIVVFTTRPDTLYGVTAVMVAPEVADYDDLIPADRKQAVLDYRAATAKKSAVERQQTEKDKTGVFSGFWVTHPLTGAQIPVWYADYVLASYGTGAVMFVPAHDERDWEFYQMRMAPVPTSTPLPTSNGTQNTPLPASPGRRGVDTPLPASPSRGGERLDSDVIDLVSLRQYKQTPEYVVELAKEMRKDQTNAEQIFWEIVRRNAFFGTHWRRQHPFGRYIADFYCHALKLVVEIDGPTHHEGTAEYDKIREEAIELYGVSILRFTNDEIYHNIEGVYDRLVQYVRDSSPLLEGEGLEERGIGGEGWGEEKLSQGLLPLIPVISSDDHDYSVSAYTGGGTLINSAQFDGKDNIEAKTAITSHLASLELGIKKTTYRLRDRSVSRQRYRGSPIPIYYTVQGLDGEEIDYGYMNNLLSLCGELQQIADQLSTKIYQVGGLAIAFDKGFIYRNNSDIDLIIPDQDYDRFFSTIQEQGYVYEGDSKENVAGLRKRGISIEIARQSQSDSMVKGGVYPEQYDNTLKTLEQITTRTVSVSVLLHHKYEIQKSRTMKKDEVDMLVLQGKLTSFDLIKIPHTIPESELPVILPLDVANYKPAGKSPLEDHPTFKYYTPTQVPYFYYDSGSVAVQPDKPNETRIRAMGIIYNPLIDKYLCLRYNDTGSLGMVTGGIEAGENPIEALKRETQEETGITDLYNITMTGRECQQYFYVSHKQRNRYNHTFMMRAETHQIDFSLSEEEAAIHTPLWLSAEELEQEVMRDSHTEHANGYPSLHFALSIINKTHYHAKKTISRINEHTKELLADHPAPTYLRECDTLDTSMCSSFYFLRFVDPRNPDQLASRELLDQTMPVDFYIGGKEHTVGHLLYSRFVHKVLFDLGVVGAPEPFQRLIHQGMLLAYDGRKMSKRRGNVITPDQIIDQYGCDTLRLYLMFMGPLESEKCRDDNSVKGVHRFVERIKKLTQKLVQTSPSLIYPATHIMIKGISEDIENLKFNTAVSKMMIYINEISALEKINQSDFLSFLKTIAPFATQMTQELWAQLGQPGLIKQQSRPEYDPTMIQTQTINLPVQINGKMRGSLDVATGVSEIEVMEMIRSDEKLSKYLEGVTVKKVIFVQDKIVNVIVG